VLLVGCWQVFLNRFSTLQASQRRLVFPACRKILTQLLTGAETVSVFFTELRVGGVGGARYFWIYYTASYLCDERAFVSLWTVPCVRL
jgi:hypothetical protein